MRQTWLFAEEITDGGNPMTQRYAMYGDAAILIYEGMQTYIYRMEDDLVPNVGIVGAHQEVYQLPDLERPMNMQFCSSSQQFHCANKPGQAENMVTMVVADENMSDIRHREPHQLHLRL